MNKTEMTIAEPIVRFVCSKIAYDETINGNLEKASAKRAVEIAAWSVTVAPEIDELLDDSPLVRVELLRFLCFDDPDQADTFDNYKSHLEFAANVEANQRLFGALENIAPTMAEHIHELSAMRTELHRN